jgi:hypothetical protein
MAQILMSDLMSHYPQQMIIVGALQQAAGHEELATAGIGCIDFWLVHDLHAQFLGSARPVHSS